jgi:hypothetical protein
MRGGTYPRGTYTNSSGKKHTIKVAGINRKKGLANIVFEADEKKNRVALSSIEIHENVYPKCKHCGGKPYTMTSDDFFGAHTNRVVHRNSKSIEVEMGKVVIAPKGTNLWTEGLATCSALYFEFGKFVFLAHIDTEEMPTHIDAIANAVAKLMKTQKLLKNVAIYTGAGGSSNNDYISFAPSEESATIAYKILATIIAKTNAKIEGKIEITPTCFLESVPLAKAPSVTSGAGGAGAGAAASAATTAKSKSPPKSSGMDEID